MSGVPDGEADATGPNASLRPWLVALEDGWHAVRPVDVTNVPGCNS